MPELLMKEAMTPRGRWLAALPVASLLTANG